MSISRKTPLKRRRWDNETEANRYGFRWGQVDVMRAASWRGGRVLVIATDRQILHVWVTPSGLIRVRKPIRQEYWG